MAWHGGATGALSAPGWSTGRLWAVSTGRLHSLAWERKPCAPALGVPLQSGAIGPWTPSRGGGWSEPRPTVGDDLFLGGNSLTSDSLPVW